MIYENTKNQSNMKNLKVLFTVLCVACATAVWGESEQITLANGAGSGSGTSYQITWSGTSCTITQTKAKSSTNVNSSYISAPRWYQGHKIIFTSKSGYTIKGATIECTSNSYANALKSSTYSTGVSANVSSSTVTITSSGDFEITMGAQSRISSVTVIYTSGSGETTVSFSSSSINFGTVTVGETKTQDVSVTINNPTPSVNFSVTGSGLSVSPSSLSQNGIVTVTYKPTTAGTLNGILTAYGGGLTTDVTATITATAQSSTTTYYTVTWKVGSDNSQTTQVAHGSKATPPITPNDNALACADTFMGWTTAPITSSQSEAPTPLFKNESPEAITANTTFYAVFATKQNGN